MQLLNSRSIGHGRAPRHWCHGQHALTFTHKCQLLNNVGRLYKFPAFAKERGKESVLI